MRKSTMASTLQSAPASTKTNSIDDVCFRAAKVTTIYNGAATPINAETTAVNSIDARWVDALHQVIDNAGMSRKEGAYELGVDPAQLSRGAVTLDRLARLPLTMQQAYLELVCIAAGLKISKANKQDVILQEVRRTVNTLFDLMEVQKEIE